MRRKSGAKECPNGGTHDGTYNAVILEKLEEVTGGLRVTLTSQGKM